MIPIYDTASTRPNPNGSGSIRDPFPANLIPVQRFSSVSNQYIAIAKTSLLPNRPGLVPGTVGYVSQNYISGGGSSAESTTKFSVKIDHSIGSAHHL